MEHLTVWMAGYTSHVLSFPSPSIVSFDRNVVEDYILDRTAQEGYTITTNWKVAESEVCIYAQFASVRKYIGPEVLKGAIYVWEMELQ